MTKKHVYTFAEANLFAESARYQLILEAERGGDIISRFRELAGKTSRLPRAMKRNALAALVATALSLGYADKVGEVVREIGDPDLAAVFGAKTGGQEVETKTGPEFRDVTELAVSQRGIEMIKEHESLRLTGYRLKDGKVTIGWGHAEDEKTSRYRVGQKITEQEAESLFRKDLATVESGIKRRLAAWAKEGVDVPLTQEMYDAMVSVGFNKGVGGLFKSGFVRHLREGNYERAGRGIAREYTAGFARKFPGIIKRRASESMHFLTGLLQGADAVR